MIKLKNFFTWIDIDEAKKNFDYKFIDYSNNPNEAQIICCPMLLSI